jgi:type IV pilus assembly protein PilB
VKAEDLPIIKIVDKLLEFGYLSKASDVHIEPFEEETTIRFRIDGILHDIVLIPKQLNELIVTRLKILSRLRTDEHYAAQDGKLKFKYGQDRIDVRVSIVPVIHGEKVVMRLLSEKLRQFDLENLGFSKVNLEKIERNIKRPWGMILATGPTGSGKTTTLYSIIKKLNRREVNISTIEDPVEYDIEGVNQIQVNPKSDLTFATGLRSIVRQDPDIIMVGEIRDEVTAKIAVNSALTGHLVLSTLHTNDSATALPRLLDMGVQHFLVASTINIVVAQRLLRRICEKCKYKTAVDEKILSLLKYELSPEIIKKYKLDSPKTMFHFGKGCEFCQNTGYQGRIGIYEVLEMTDEIKELVMAKADASEIKKKAMEQGMLPMIEDGLLKVLEGVTTIDELLRVTQE